VARATYLYNEGTRYWYGTQAHVGQLARDRAEQIRSSRGDIIELEIRDRLTSMSSPRHEFAGVHVMPSSAADVADSDEVRLVVLSPEQSHQGRGESAATAAALTILEQRGNAARLYKNMLTFLVPEQRHVESLLESTATYLAWKQLDAEKVSPLNLDPLNQKQVEDRRREATARLDAALREAYKISLVPLQPEASAVVQFDVVRCDGADGLAERCSKKLSNQGVLNTTYSTEMLRGIIDGVLSPMWSTGHCSVKDLWDVFARYTYLPRFKNMTSLVSVLVEGANRIGWEGSTWALAAGAKPDGTYIDLVAGSLATGVNGTWLIVRPDIAAAIVSAKPKPDPEPNPIPSKGSQPGSTPGGTPGPGPVAPTRFWGSKDLNTTAAQLRRDFERVEQEVIALMQRELGSEVTVTVNIEVVNDNGFSENVVRNVKANADTLRFDDHGFA